MAAYIVISLCVFVLDPFFFFKWRCVSRIRGAELSDTNNMFPIGPLTTTRLTCEQKKSLAWQLQLNTRCSNIWSHQSCRHYLRDFIFCPVSSHISYLSSHMRTSCGSDSPEIHCQLLTHYKLQAAWLHSSCSCNAHHSVYCG